MVPDALRAAGAEVVVHDDSYPQSTLDADLLREVGAKGWVFVTKDKRIRRRPNELEALRNAGVRAFVVTAGNLSGPEVAALLAAHLLRMTRIATTQSPPFWARETRSGIDVEPL